MKKTKKAKNMLANELLTKSDIELLKTALYNWAINGSDLAPPYCYDLWYRLKIATREKGATQELRDLRKMFKN